MKASMCSISPLRIRNQKKHPLSFHRSLPIDAAGVTTGVRKLTEMSANSISGRLKNVKVMDAPSSDLVSTYPSCYSDHMDPRKPRKDLSGSMGLLAGGGTSNRLHLGGRSHVWDGRCPSRRAAFPRKMTGWNTKKYHIHVYSCSLMLQGHLITVSKPGLSRRGANQRMMLCTCLISRCFACPTLTRFKLDNNRPWVCTILLPSAPSVDGDAGPGTTHAPTCNGW